MTIYIAAGPNAKMAIYTTAVFNAKMVVYLAVGSDVKGQSLEIP